MKKRIIIFFIFIIFLGFNLPCIAQFTEKELAERTKWEEYLKTAEIIDSNQMWGREAVTNPFKLTLKKDDISRNALWKDAEGKEKGYWEGWKYEIAAYRFDKYLGLNMVPPTVEKTFKGKRGSCQLWVEYKMKLSDKIKNNIRMPSYKIFPWNRAVFLQRAFDNLIANIDRDNARNVFITEDWRLILIDHSRSFRTSKKYKKQLIYSEKHKQGPRLMEQLPRSFVEKIKTLNFEVIKDIVGEYLNEDEINAVLARKELILKEIDRLIKKNGEDKVLY